MLFGHHLFLGVPLRPQQDDVTLWGEDADQKSVTGGQDGKDLHGNRELPRRADVSGDERHPHGAEDQHAEGDELGLVEVVWEFPGQEGQEEAEGGQQADVPQDQGEACNGAHSTLQQDLGPLVSSDAPLCRPRGGQGQPQHTDQHLGTESLQL